MCLVSSFVRKFVWLSVYSRRRFSQKFVKISFILGDLYTLLPGIRAHGYCRFSKARHCFYTSTIKNTVPSPRRPVHHFLPPSSYPPPLVFSCFRTCFHGSVRVRRGNACEGQSPGGPSPERLDVGGKNSQKYGKIGDVTVSDVASDAKLVRREIKTATSGAVPFCSRSRESLFLFQFNFIVRSILRRRDRG